MINNPYFPGVPQWIQTVEMKSAWREIQAAGPNNRMSGAFGRRYWSSEMDNSLFESGLEVDIEFQQLDDNPNRTKGKNKAWKPWEDRLLAREIVGGNIQNSSRGQKLRKWRQVSYPGRKGIKNQY